ncbi:MAG: hypothetical protein ACI4VH_05395 [Clostridia bacterium]
MELSINTRQVYSEIDEFLGLITKEERDEIPKKLRDFFREEKDTSYHKNINSNIPIEEQNLKEETLAIIALLNLQYWCKDENEKQRLQQIYANNENKYQEELREKYNPNNIFKNKNDVTTNIGNGNGEDISINMQIVEYKEPIFKRIVNKVLEFLHIK